MTTTKARYKTYLFKRPESANWWVRLRSGGERKEQSLFTADKAEAELRATPLIQAHKAALIAARPRIEPVEGHFHKPGARTLPDGRHIFADDRQWHVLDDAGNITDTFPNTRTEYRIINLRRLGLPYAPVDVEESVVVRPSLRTKDGDDDLLNDYLTEAGLEGYAKKAAERDWALFRTVINKPLAKCTRDDGKMLVKHMEDEADDPPKSATLRRRMVPLIATVNLAIANSKHVGVNPFISCIPDRDDEVERDPFNDNDVKLMKANLHLLNESDQLLVRIVATTGMRRGEAFQIASEDTENDIRYCVVGADKGMAKRRVPFPKDLLPYLPKRITGPLLTGRADNAGKRIRAWLTDIGVINEKDGRDIAPNHSFRHRAAQRMRAASIPEDVREAIGGWADGKKTSKKYGNKHGKGYAVSVLRKAIDRIGF